jgi:hypothetical protein
MMLEFYGTLMKRIYFVKTRIYTDFNYSGILSFRRRRNLLEKLDKDWTFVAELLAKISRRNDNDCGYLYKIKVHNTFFDKAIEEKQKKKSASIRVFAIANPFYLRFNLGSQPKQSSYQIHFHLLKYN